jgi:hypothetical protein
MRDGAVLEAMVRRLRCAARLIVAFGAGAALVVGQRRLAGRCVAGVSRSVGIDRCMSEVMRVLWTRDVWRHCIWEAAFLPGD